MNQTDTTTTTTTTTPLMQEACSYYGMDNDQAELRALFVAMRMCCDNLVKTTKEIDFTEYEIDEKTLKITKITP